jgi:hypothetical protein
MSTAAAQYPIMCWEWEGGAIPADREAADEGTAVEKNAVIRASDRPVVVAKPVAA